MTTEIVLQCIKEYIKEDQCEGTDTILLAVRQILGNEILLSDLDEQFDRCLNEHVMCIALLVDMCRLIPVLLQFIRRAVLVSKKLTVKQVKYVIYASLYAYLLKNEGSFIYEISEPILRSSFNGIWFLLELAPDAIKIAKNSASKCCSGKHKSTRPY